MPSSDRAGSPTNSVSLVVNAADMAYRAIKSQMLSGVLAPGEALTERSLAAKVGVSRTPLREALFRLERDRLVERNARGVVRVVRLTARDVQDIYACRAELEVLAVRLIVERASNPELENLARLAESGAHAVDRMAVSAIVAANDAFNAALYEMAANPWILSAMGPLRGQLDRIQNVITHLADPAAFTKEQLTIVAALEARDADAAETAVREAIDSELRAVRKHLEAVLSVSTPEPAPKKSVKKREPSRR